MTNTNTANYFSGFNPENNLIIGTGRYLMYHAFRGTLHKIGVHESFGFWIFKWLSAHRTYSRAFYRGTPSLKMMVHKARGSYANKSFFDPCPIEYTSNVQLYSISGSQLPITWAEILIYWEVGQAFISQYVAQR